MKRYRKILFFLGLALTLALASIFGNDMDSAEMEAQRYCKMVHDGHWPDYREAYDKFCNGPHWNGK